MVLDRILDVREILKGKSAYILLRRAHISSGHEGVFAATTSLTPCIALQRLSKGEAQLG